jgi:hypothetical protein
MHRKRSTLLLSARGVSATEANVPRAGQGDLLAALVPP